MSQTRCITKTGKTRELSWHCRFLTAVILLFQVFHLSKASPAFLTGTQTSYCVSEGLGSKYTSTSESSMSAEEETAIKYLHCSLSLQALTPRTPCGFPYLCLPPQRGHLQVQGKAVSARPFCVHGREACAGLRQRGGLRVHLGGQPFCDSGFGAHKSLLEREGRGGRARPLHFCGRTSQGYGKRLRKGAIFVCPVD